MPDGSHHFVKLTELGLSTAKELCVLAESFAIEDEDVIRITTGYFCGTFSQPALILPDGMSFNMSVTETLREKLIYVR